MCLDFRTTSRRTAGTCLHMRRRMCPYACLCACLYTHVYLQVRRNEALAQGLANVVTGIFGGMGGFLWSYGIYSCGLYSYGQADNN